MGVPIYDAKSIREVPRHIRWRIRTVHELIKEANLTLAGNSKAMGVYDWSNHH